MKILKILGVLVAPLVVGPLLAIGEIKPMGKAWWEASRESADLAPNPATTQEAVVQVYAARAFSWRGLLGIHTWIAVKPTKASSFTVYQLVGWRLRRGANAVVIEQDIPDRLWYDAIPEVLADIRGDGVDAIIEKIDGAARSYPYSDTYSVWPGPNSNTFTAWIARRVPELQLDLPPTAIGKDWLGVDGPFSKSPSGTGYQLCLFGVMGFLVGLQEGVEINVAGLNFGLDPLELSIRLPGLGKLGANRSVRPRYLASKAINH
ncbi:MAG: hypothetical protein CMM58_02390 [Rhodospirillaceae bacterium]|nr:hypothetical protein [Rhodospirillaceae bacterium]|tara:strand:- start:4264 stop:5049 length:786 start_codon:yes stop_codon:yes gene_type:complete